MAKDKLVTLRVTEDQRDRLNAEAKHRGLTQAQALRQAISMWMRATSDDRPA